MPAPLQAPSAQFSAVDIALWQAFNNILSVTIEGISRQVPAFVQTPEEQFGKAQYPNPSFGIHAFDMMPVPEREVAKIWAYSDRNESAMNRRPAPVKVDLYYQITTQSYFAAHDRLLFKTILKVLPPRTRLVVSEETGAVNPVQYALHCFYESMQTLDGQDQQYRIFRKALTYRILGWLDEGIKTSQKIALTIEGAVGASKSVLTQQLDFTEIY